MRVAPTVTVTESDREILNAWIAAGTPRRRVHRARIVLLASEGLTNLEIAERLKIDRRAVGRWRNRFVQRGIEGIEREAPRRKPNTFRDKLSRLILQTTLTVPPATASAGRPGR